METTAPTLRRMGRYTLYDKIASGGMATLYFGRLLGPSGFARTVAVKRMHPQYAHDPTFSAMFLDEARLVSRIRSPFVVPTLDVVSDGGELAIVMEYVHGESLAALESSHVPVTVAVAVIGGVLRGLHAAHEARSEQGAPLGIVHRDVSPHNVLVGTDGLAHLVDFGVAKAAGRMQTTREGQLKGKLSYMAPERLRGDAVTRRSDVYSAAVVLWELLSGRRLFEAGDEGAVVTAVLVGDVQAPGRAARDRRLAADVRAIEGLDPVVMRGLDRDPSRRFETAHEMAVALEACLAPASSAEVARWLEEAAAPALARRAEAIAAIEAEPREEASGLSVVSGVPSGPPRSRRRRAALVVAGGLLAAAAIAVSRAPWRSPALAATPALAPAPSPAPEIDLPVSLAAVVPSSPPSPSSSTVRHAPSAPRSADCNPPFTWDDQGKKHYKRQCL